MASWGSTRDLSQKSNGLVIPLKTLKTDNMGSLNKNASSRSPGTPVKDPKEPKNNNYSMPTGTFYGAGPKRPTSATSQIKSVTSSLNGPFKQHHISGKSSPGSSDLVANRARPTKSYVRKKITDEEKRVIEARKRVESNKRTVIRNAGDQPIKAQVISDGEVSSPSPLSSPLRKDAISKSKRVPVPDFDDSFGKLIKSTAQKRVPTKKPKTIFSDSEDEGPSDLLKQTRSLGANDGFEESMIQARKKAEKLPYDTSISREKTKSIPTSRSISPPKDIEHIDLSSPVKEQRRVRKIVHSDNESDTPNTSTASKKQAKKIRVVKKKSSVPTRKSPRKQNSITAMLTSSAKKSDSKKKKGSDDEDDIVVSEDDELDSIFSTEGSATLAAKKRLEELKAAKTTKEKRAFDEDEKGVWNASYKAGRKLLALGRKMKAEDDEFNEAIKNTNVWIPDSQTDDLLDVDLDADLSLGFKNDYEEVDEKVNEIKQTRLVKAKYKDQEYNGALSRRELESKANQYLDCVPQILSGGIASAYYEKSKRFMEGSRSTTISNSDYNRDEFSQFSIGFYGLKRQSVIAMLIRRKYAEEIQKAAESNKTIQFWSIDPFILYVLAPEVAMRVAASEMEMSEDSVVELFQKTIDYGKYITDPVPIN